MIPPSQILIMLAQKEYGVKKNTVSFMDPPKVDDVSKTGNRQVIYYS